MAIQQLHPEEHNIVNQPSKVRALHDHVLVDLIDAGERISAGGIVVLDDDKKEHGIRPRWGKVCVIGSKQTDVKVGDYVLIEHGRWTRVSTVQLDSGEIVDLRRVDENAILAVSDSLPNSV